jgi:hypothetical protein
VDVDAHGRIEGVVVGEEVQDALVGLVEDRVRAVPIERCVVAVMLLTPFFHWYSPNLFRNSLVE